MIENCPSKPVPSISTKLGQPEAKRSSFPLCAIPFFCVPSVGTPGKREEGRADSQRTNPGRTIGCGHGATPSSPCSLSPTSLAPASACAPRLAAPRSRVGGGKGAEQGRGLISRETASCC